MRFWEWEHHGRDRAGKPLRWSILEGSLNGKYTVIGEFEGGVGTIFTLDTGAHPRHLIAKTFRINSRETPEHIQYLIKRFLHEINETLKYSHHPLVLRHVDVRICAGVPLVISRKWDLTLRDLIAEGPVSPAEATALIIQLAHALAYCSARGLVAHQDLKPENILLDRLERFRGPGDAKPPINRAIIADFGMANAFGVFGKPYGSRPYMAPEQYGQPLTLAKADVFALGVMLHELLTGGLHPIGEITSDVWPKALPVKGNKWSHEDIWKKWARHPQPVDPMRIPARPLAHVINKCLDADISARHSAASLKAVLLEYLKSCDKEIHAYLPVVLSHFDQLAASSETGGWPHYEHLLEQVNAFDYS